MSGKIRVAAEIYAAGKVRIDQPKPEEFQVCEDCEKVKNDYRHISPTPQATAEEFETWSKYMARWTLAYPVEIEFEVYVDGAGHLRIGFLYPKEKNSRKPNELLDRTQAIGYLAPSHFPDVNTPRWIRANILYHLNHELDEWLTFDRERPFDPHHESAYHCTECTERWKREHPE